MTTIHPFVLDELVRQHREELMNEARLARRRRARRRRGDE